jgi:hypothetical protein
MHHICHKLVFFLLLFSAIAWAGEIQKTDRFAQGYRFERANWIYVHLEGTPYQIARSKR